MFDLILIEFLYNDKLMEMYGIIKVLLYNRTNSIFRLFWRCRQTTEIHSSALSVHLLFSNFFLILPNSRELYCTIGESNIFLNIKCLSRKYIFSMHTHASTIVTEMLVYLIIILFCLWFRNWLYDEINGLY